MRGLCAGALHRTAAQASRPATHILASSWPPPLAPPPRPAAPDRLFVRSQALRSFVPPLDQLGSNRRALGRLVDSFRHHLAPKQPSHSRPRLADGPGSSSLCQQTDGNLFLPLLCADIHHKQQKEQRQHLPASPVCAFLHCVLLPVAYECHGDSLDSCMSPSS